MKTVGIVTYFKSYNYGVWLQAYATQTFFEKNGYNAQVINYANKKESSLTKYSYKENDKISGYVTSFIKSLLFGKVAYYKKGFKKNIDDYYNLSPELYKNVKEMDKIYYDILVVGSDQLWNPRITYDKLDPVFLLDFGEAEKRISVSTSIGSDIIRDEDRRVLKKAFNTFSAISVREKFAQQQLQGLTDKQIKITVDPTFLLKREDWLGLIKKNSICKIENEKYILTYFVSSDKRSERYTSTIESYSKSLGLPVWAVQFSRAKSTPCDKKILGASIADFLKYILNATLIITDSFHGVALSMNLNKDFVAIENKKNPERVRYLLDKLDLSDRIEMDAKDNCSIDYSIVNIKVESLREDSASWILDAAEG